MFESILGAAASTVSDGSTATSVSGLALVACILASLLLGIVIAAAYMYRNRHTKSFVTTLAILPAVVCVVIMMVNGNVGAGVAVAGTFSLVRFRSAPGSARDIGFIFLAMCDGLVCGMGYLGYAVLVTAIIGSVYLALQASSFGGGNRSSDLQLVIVVPEDLDFVGLFDDVLDRYCTYHESTGVKTTNMGSLYKLTYRIGLADVSQERDLINEIRCRNGNLEVALTEQPTAAEAL
jgi:hypothetical protein